MLCLEPTSKMWLFETPFYGCILTCQWNVLILNLQFNEFWQIQTPMQPSPPLRQNIFYHPLQFTWPICRYPYPETSGLSKNWFAFCHYKLVVTFLEYQRNWILFSVCQAFFVQHDVFKHRLYSDVHQSFISLCWWAVILFPPLLPAVSSDLRLEHLKEWDRGKGHFIPKQVISILHNPERVLRKPLFSVG